MANYFEAKKHAYRQTQDGIVISFTVHPNDMGAEIATAALGTRYMVAFCEIGDDETPRPDATPAGAVVAARSGVTAGETAAKPKRAFSELSLPQQCGIRCDDEQFGDFIATKFPNNYANCASVAGTVRAIIGVKSRGELQADGPAADKWRAMESDFQAWLTDKKYADVRR